jgi:hypothetical protein
LTCGGGQYRGGKFWPKSQHCNGYHCSRSCFWPSPDRSPHATASSRLRKRPAKPPRTAPRPALRPVQRLARRGRRVPVTPARPVAPGRPGRLQAPLAPPGPAPARRPVLERAGLLRRRSKAWNGSGWCWTGGKSARSSTAALVSNDTISLARCVKRSHFRRSHFRSETEKGPLRLRSGPLRSLDLCNQGKRPRSRRGSRSTQGMKGRS